MDCAVGVLAVADADHPGAGEGFGQAPAARADGSERRPAAAVSDEPAGLAAGPGRDR